MVWFEKVKGKTALVLRNQGVRTEDATVFKRDEQMNATMGLLWKIRRASRGGTDAGGQSAVFSADFMEVSVFDFGFQLYK